MWHLHTTLQGPVARTPPAYGPLFAITVLLLRMADSEAPHPEGLPCNICLESDRPGHSAAAALR